MPIRIRHRDKNSGSSQQPVKIVDLAKQMIRLLGHVEGRDMRIVFTGVRPGEKLEEQLVGCNETVAETEHPKIRRIEFADNGVNREALDSEIDYLIEKCVAMELDKVRQKLMQMVPEYNPNLSQETLSWLPWKRAEVEPEPQAIHRVET